MDFTVGASNNKLFKEFLENCTECVDYKDLIARINILSENQTLIYNHEVSKHLLVFSKKDNLWSLRVLNQGSREDQNREDQKTTLSPFAKWRDALKTRIDPLIAQYEDIPVLEEEWLKSICNNQNFFNLLKVLDPYKKKRVDQAPTESAEPRFRWITTGRNRENQNKLLVTRQFFSSSEDQYKEYKRSYFFHRLDQLNQLKGSNAKKAYELSVKLTRSLEKYSDYFLPDEKDKLQDQLQQNSYIENTEKNALENVIQLELKDSPVVPTPNKGIDDVTVEASITTENPRKKQRQEANSIINNNFWIKYNETQRNKDIARLYIKSEQSHRFIKEDQMDSYEDFDVNKLPKITSLEWKNEYNSYLIFEGVDRIKNLECIVHLIEQLKEGPLKNNSSLIAGLIFYLFVDGKFNNVVTIDNKLDSFFNTTFNDLAEHDKYRGLCSRLKKCLDSNSRNENSKSVLEDLEKFISNLKPFGTYNEKFKIKNYFNLKESDQESRGNTALDPITIAENAFNTDYDKVDKGLLESSKQKVIDLENWLCPSELVERFSRESEECIKNQSNQHLALPHIGPLEAINSFLNRENFSLRLFERQFFTSAWMTDEIVKKVNQSNYPNDFVGKILEQRAQTPLPWVECLKNPEFQDKVVEFLRAAAQRIEEEEEEILDSREVDRFFWIVFKISPYLKDDFYSKLPEIRLSYDRNASCFSMALLQIYNYMKTGNKGFIHIPTGDSFPFDIHCTQKPLLKDFIWMTDKVNQMFENTPYVPEETIRQLLREAYPVNDPEVKAPTMPAPHFNHRMESVVPPPVGVFYTGEEIFLNKTEEGYFLRSRPDLELRKSDKTNYGNVLCEKGEEIAHLFTINLRGKKTFSIQYKDEKYHPKTIEEKLALLWVAASTKNEKDIWKEFKNLPLTVHKLSAISCDLIESIVDLLKNNLDENRVQSVAIAMHCIERFSSWSDSEEKSLKDILIKTWNLYKDLHQNVPLEYAINEEQYKNLLSAESDSLKVTQVYTPSSSLPTMSEAFFNKMLRYDILSNECGSLFNKFQKYEKNTIIKYIDLRNVIIKIIPVIMVLGHVLLRLMGFCYLLSVRKNVFSLYDDIQIPNISAKSSTEQKLQIKMLLCCKVHNKKQLIDFGNDNSRQSEESHLNEIAVSIINWAIDHDFMPKTNESMGHFLARAELHKVNLSLLGWIKWLIKGGHKEKFTNPQNNPPVEKEVDFSVDKRLLPIEFGLVNSYEPDSAEREILNLANAPTSATRRKNLHAKLAREVVWADIQWLIIQENGMKNLREINPDLKEADCEKIEQRLLNHLNKAKNGGQRFEDKLLSKPHIRAVLLFEKVTKMTVRDEQLEKIEQLLQEDSSDVYKNCALQMIMGGGKTSVLASILLRVGAKENHISIFEPPAAQFDTLVTTLTQWQKERFGQEVVPIDYTFAQLHNLPVLQKLQDQILNAKKQGHVLLMHPSVVPSLQMLLKTTQNEEVTCCIHEIRQLLLSHGDRFIDEIDQNFDPLKDYSIAVGPDHTPTTKLLNELKHLFILHKQDEKLWSAICKNQPSLIDLEEYKKIKKEQIIPKLAITYGIKPEFLESFTRYLSGEESNQNQEDQKFLDYLKEHSSRESIACCCYWLTRLLPFTLLREVNSNFGRGHQMMGIVPYLGAAVPSTTRKVAQVHEEISYHFMTAVSHPIEDKGIEEIFNYFAERVNPGKRVLGREFTEQFKDIFGEEFNANSFEKNEFTRIIYDSGKTKIKLTAKGLKKFSEYVNQDPLRKLEAEVILMRLHVRYFKEQYTSTSQDASTWYKSNRGFSGTLPDYMQSIDHELALDQTSDSSVIEKMKDKNGDILCFEHLDEVFDKACGTGGIIDSAGLFRNLDSFEVAKKILDKDKEINDVLFFGKKDKEDASPDTPMLLRKGADGNHLLYVIGETRKEVLDAFGVDRAKLFVYYDQRHCEATDVTQEQNRCNLITFGLNTTTRDLLQGVMRLRQYVSGKQSVFYVMEKSVKEKLFGMEKNPSVKDLIEQSEKTEKAFNEKRIYRSLFQRVDSIILSVAEKMVENQVNKHQLLNFFIKKVNGHSLYELFNGFLEDKDPKEMIKNYMKKRKESFLELAKDLATQDVRDKIESEFRKINEYIESLSSKAEYLTNPIPSNESSLGSHQEVEQATQTQQATEKEQETQTETITERFCDNPIMGTPWEEKCDFKEVPVTKHYQPLCRDLKIEGELFGDILVSENWARTFKEKAHSLNHPLQKRADYLLVRKKSNSLQVVVISGYDLQNYTLGKKKLKRDEAIISSDRSPLGKIHFVKDNGPGSFNLSRAQTVCLERSLVNIAYLNGNVKFIYDKFRKNELKLTSEHLSFLRLRVENHLPIIKMSKRFSWVKRMVRGAMKSTFKSLSDQTLQGMLPEMDREEVIQMKKEIIETLSKESVSRLIKTSYGLNQKNSELAMIEAMETSLKEAVV